MGTGIDSARRIDGVVITALREISDERGSVLHMLRCDAPEFVRFGECYFSELLPGAIKAWKRNMNQTQHLAAPVGRVRLVIYDDRESSQTRRTLLVLELGRPDAYVRVRIPPGVWYGFACVGPTAALLANCSDLPHDPSTNELRSQDELEIPYAWAEGGTESKLP